MNSMHDRGLVASWSPLAAHPVHTINPPSNLLIPSINACPCICFIWMRLELYNIVTVHTKKTSLTIVCRWTVRFSSNEYGIHLVSGLMEDGKIAHCYEFATTNHEVGVESRGTRCFLFEPEIILWWCIE